MSNEIRIVLVEDMATEAELALHQLRVGGIACAWKRVETEHELRQVLRDFQPSLILSDFTLPQFNGLRALEVARECAPDVPFIFVSGTIGEERAIEALRRGAVDYVLKTNLARLAPAVRRAIDEADARRQHQEQIARLTRVLRMLSGINGVVPRIQDRAGLLQEVCRLAVTVGGYAVALVAMTQTGARGVKPVAWTGSQEELAEKLRLSVVESGERETSIVARVVRSGTPFICNDTSALDGTLDATANLLRSECRSVVALALQVDKTPIGVLLIAARGAGAASEEEMRMLREVAANVSFALQYLHKENTVRFLSHFDSQTGLAKRTLFCERLGRLLDKVGRQGRSAVVAIDIEQLSAINDSFGRHVGDLLLQHVADRLRRRFHHTELLAHLAGGTFAVVVESSGRPEELSALVQQHVTEVFGQPFDLEGKEIPVAVKSGLAAFPDNGRDAGTLMQNAEAALRNAKASGTRHLRHSTEMSSEAVARLALEHKLRAALEKRQFELHYQPKVSVKTRRIQGVEALIRWRDPEVGLVSPATFLPLLESTGLIVDVGDWVMEQAALDCQHWQSLGLPTVRVAVNISPAELRRHDFATRFLEITKSWSSAHCGLDIEITEGALLDDSPAELKKLKILRSLGVGVAIDDFGTGYSSLGRLSELPIDTLKIDRSFTNRLPGDPAGRTLVSTVVALGKAFHMTVVAEGVEKQEQLDLLWQLGCDQSQGYLHSKPVTRDQFSELLAHGNGRMILPADYANDPALDARA